MAKFCGNCGHQAEDNDNVCSNCGTVFVAEEEIKEPVIEETAEVVEEVTEETVAAEGETEAAKPLPLSALTSIDFKNIKPEEKELLKKCGIFAGIGVAALIFLIVAIIIFVTIIGSFGAKGVVKDVMNDLVDGKADAFVENTSDTMLEVFDEMGMDEDDILDTYEERIDSILDYLEEEVGSGCDFDYEIIEITELSDRKLDDFNESLEEMMDVQASAIAEAEVELTATKGKKSETIEITFALADVDGWSVVDMEVDY